MNKAIKHITIEADEDFVLLGWHNSGFAHRMLGRVVHNALKNPPQIIGIYKKGKMNKL